MHSTQRRRDAETSAGYYATEWPVVEGDGKPASVILTRRRGDAETRRSAQRSGEVKERTSAETAEDGGLRCGADGFPEGKRRVPCHGRGRGGTGWATRECDFDAEARRRGDKRGEAAQSKRGRARRQRRMVAFGAERTGFRREDILTRRRGGRRVQGRGQRGFILLPGGGRGGRRNPRPCRSTSRRDCARVASGRGRVG